MNTGIDHEDNDEEENLTVIIFGLWSKVSLANLL